MRRMKRVYDYKRVDAAKEAIKKAFSELRKAGFIARSNFMCCMSCASYGLAEMARERGIEKMVYWHRQDEEYLKEKGILFLRYSSMKDDDEASRSVGEEVVEALKRNGLSVEWSGDLNKCIEVTA